MLQSHLLRVCYAPLILCEILVLTTLGKREGTAGFVGRGVAMASWWHDEVGHGSGNGGSQQCEMVVLATLRWGGANEQGAAGLCGVEHNNWFVGKARWFRGCLIKCGSTRLCVTEAYGGWVGVVCCSGG